MTAAAGAAHSCIAAGPEAARLHLPGSGPLAVGERRAVSVTGDVIHGIPDAVYTWTVIPGRVAFPAPEKKEEPEPGGR